MSPTSTSCLALGLSNPCDETLVLRGPLDGPILLYVPDQSSVHLWVGHRKVVSPPQQQPVGCDEVKEIQVLHVATHLNGDHV